MVTGLEILKDRPRVTEETMDLSHLSTLPTNTFGYHYYRFMHDNGLSAQRATTKFVEDEELAYVMTRYRENHDFLHTLTGELVVSTEQRVSCGSRIGLLINIADFFKSYF